MDSNHRHRTLQARTLLAEPFRNKTEADIENRTRNICLEGRDFTIKLHPQFIADHPKGFATAV